MTATRNITALSLRTVLLPTCSGNSIKNSLRMGGVGPTHRQERPLHAIRSTIESRSETNNNCMLPQPTTSPPHTSPSSGSSASSQSRPFFVASSSGSYSVIDTQKITSTFHSKPTAVAIHRLLSNIGAPTSLRNIELIIQERDDCSGCKDAVNGARGRSTSHTIRDGMTADEIIDLIAQIRSL